MSHLRGGLMVSALDLGVALYSHMYNASLHSSV